MRVIRSVLAVVMLLIPSKSWCASDVEERGGTTRYYINLQAGRIDLWDGQISTEKGELVERIKTISNGVMKNNTEKLEFYFVPESVTSFNGTPSFLVMALKDILGQKPDHPLKEITFIQNGNNNPRGGQFLILERDHLPSVQKLFPEVKINLEEYFVPQGRIKSQ
jgi:hypothetical protein